MEDAFSENDSRPFPQNATRIYLPVLERNRPDQLAANAHVHQNNTPATDWETVDLANPAVSVLLIAKLSGQLASVPDMINELETVAGFFVSDRVKSIVLRAAAESA